jgi:hypothetical protein
MRFHKEIVSGWTGPKTQEKGRFFKRLVMANLTQPWWVNVTPLPVYGILYQYLCF